jgi:DNA repair exonuclease SbcCD ATPase subunit
MDNLETEMNNLKLEIEKGVVVEDLIPISAMLNHYDTLRNEHKPYEETIEYENLLKDIERLESTLPERPNNDAVELTNEKREIMKCLEDLNRQYGLKEKANSIRADIATLNDERRDVACELAKLEGILAKCKEYIEERANIISNRVNDKLSGCKVVMYSEQKDGTMRPDCVITDLLGVKYATLSNSARLRVNLQMSKLFRAHYDIELPYFVDEASIFSANSLPMFDTQCVYLYASDSKTIIVE